jgi:O-antigen ligase
LLTILPLTAIYVLVAKEKWLRAIAAVSLPFIVNTLILCNSRGAMVSLLVASGAGMVLIQRGYRLRFAAVGLAAVVGFFLLADDTFIRRQQTTANYENDGSAQGRISSWKGAAALVADYPFGAGGRGFHTLSPIYAAEVVAKTRDEGRAPHNTYMLVASEWGVLGLILWIGFHTSTFVMLHRIKARAKATDFYYWRALAMQLSLIAVLIASTFTDRLYAEAPYWLAAMVYALQRIQHTDYAEDAEATTSDATTVVPPPERAAVSSAA